MPGFFVEKFVIYRRKYVKFNFTQYLSHYDRFDGETPRNFPLEKHVLNLQAAVRAQVEKMKRQKRLEREKKVQEDMDEERKLQAERDLLKTQFEMNQYSPLITCNIFNFQAAVRAQVEEKERQKRLERENEVKEDMEEERKFQAERDLLKTQFEMEQCVSLIACIIFNFQAAVRAQVEEKERLKRLEREKKVQEDLEEERKLQAERDLLKTQFEIEQQKTRQKEVSVEKSGEKNLDASEFYFSQSRLDNVSC